jgi:hypothetical protein
LETQLVDQLAALFFFSLIGGSVVSLVLFPKLPRTVAVPLTVLALVWVPIVCWASFAILSSIPDPSMSILFTAAGATLGVWMGGGYVENKRGPHIP